MLAAQQWAAASIPPSAQHISPAAPRFALFRASRPTRNRLRSSSSSGCVQLLSRDPSQAALTLLILLPQCCPKQPLLRVEPTCSLGCPQRAQLPLLSKGSPTAHEGSDTRFGPEPSPGHHKSLCQWSALHFQPLHMEWSKPRVNQGTVGCEILKERAGREV